LFQQFFKNQTALGAFEDVAILSWTDMKYRIKKIKQKQF